MSLRVLIVESSYPKDFHNQELDGLSVSSLLTTIRVTNRLLYVLDKKHLKKAISEGISQRFNILHLSCHGGETGIALSDNHQPTWEEFAHVFQNVASAPAVLIISMLWCIFRYWTSICKAKKSSKDHFWVNRGAEFQRVCRRLVDSTSQI